MTAPALLDVQQVARLLACSASTVHRLIAAGQLPAVDIGTGRAKTRIAEQDLAAFVDRRRRTARRKKGVA